MPREKKTRGPSFVVEDRLSCIYTNGSRQHRQEVRRDTYDITTSTWRIKPCTAYVMREPAGPHATQS